MAGIITPESLESEELLNIPVAGAGTLCRVVSGYANFMDKNITNAFGAPIGLEPLPGEDILQPLPLSGDFEPNDDDKTWRAFEVHMEVGPNWRSVRDVSPIVTVAGFTFRDNDAANASGTEIRSCTWDTVGLTGDQSEFERIRLKVDVRMCGGQQYSIIKLAYHLVAVGR
ncbi:hypothetical protein H5U98_26105 [Mycolicibacterium boenickei]|uniref:Uncharacterized protein n=1 Tax=Mycolicibacterium boenickei TaxID=146017 RepID=A0AAX2ZUI9_9MYCO|nr:MULTISPECIES: hypothetical protein [Mycolicibacterium]MBX8686302.1 hypothetical protein [Mycobacterium sp. 20091114027_K0903767]OCB49011.1 hypothetical protein A5721_04390 [Mycolicibacterium vulneris]PEG61083.1 hypothetical protein CQY21_07945 [Mycolicibacterium boenickei]TVY02665.1 hypothetical protein FPV58_11835 [Mycolicibacterium porcinum]UNB98928.1 hypothetical protein H5U98_26105 [Mycolicibacterium boenickei]